MSDSKAVAMKNVGFWGVFLRTMVQLLVGANVVPSTLILFALSMEAITCSESSVLKRGRLRHITEYCIFHSHRRENLKSYTALTDWVL
jgi:hypothetical protein